VLAIVIAWYAGGAALGALVARHWGGALWIAVLAAAACSGVDAAVGSKPEPAP